MQTLIHRFLRTGTLLSTLGFLASVLLQICARFLLPSAPAWTEEASRLLFIYAVAFSAGLALEQQEYVYLDWIYNKLPQRWQRTLRIAIQVITCGLFLIISYHSIPFVRLGFAETSPGMGIPMAYAFFSLFVLAISVSYYACSGLIDEWKNETP